MVLYPETRSKLMRMKKAELVDFIEFVLRYKRAEQQLDWWKTGIPKVGHELAADGEGYQDAERSEFGVDHVYKTRIDCNQRAEESTVTNGRRGGQGRSDMNSLFPLQAAILQADARAIPLRDQSVHCVVTSPPYWGLRDYGQGGQLGLEATPEEYLSNMVGVFREVWRVLRDDGTAWVNMGDCYTQGATGKTHNREGDGTGGVTAWKGDRITTLSPGLKPKDLVGMPWRLAFALQADGWYLRSDIIWSKPNPMPEGVRDRPTKAHEYVFLLSKRGRYFYDADAVREEHQPDSIKRDALGWKAAFKGRHTQPGEKRPHSTDHNGFCNPAGRNLRDVWTLSTQPYPEAHFATYPEKLVKPCIKAGCPKGDSLRPVRRQRDHGGGGLEVGPPGGGDGYRIS
jgi:DNA modification methylase